MKKTLKEIKINKGFTLVEILAVIVVLAILLLLAIPTVLSVVANANKSTFIEFADKVVNLGNKEIAIADVKEVEGKSVCVIYDITKDLGLDSYGKFKGWVLINPDNDDNYITIFNDEYALVGFHHNDASLKMIDYIKKRSEVDDSLLTLEHLASFSDCMNYEADEGVKENEEYIRKISTTLVDGITFNNSLKKLAGSLNNIKYFKRSDSLPNDVTKLNLAAQDNMHEFWTWFEGDTIYY